MRIESPDSRLFALAAYHGRLYATANRLARLDPNAIHAGPNGDPTVQAVTLNNFRLYFGPVVPSETIDRHWAPAHDSRVRGAAPA